MTRLLIVLFISLSLMSCQKPLVPLNDYAFETKVVVNGEEKYLKKQYQCHYEDLTWVSSRGPNWHNREGKYSIRVLGVLNDGFRFEALPYLNSYRSECPEERKKVYTRLFVEIDESTVESFDRQRKHGTKHNIAIENSNIDITGTGISIFKEQSDWLRAKKPETNYYTIYATYYKRINWKPASKIDSFIKSKKMEWFESGKSYPFTSWSSDDVTFARLRKLNKNSSPRISLRLKGDEWIISNEKEHAIQWRIEPMYTDKSDKLTPSTMLKQWIAFDGSRIEIPLKKYYRIFYHPKSDSLIEFRVEHVKLW